MVFVIDTSGSIGSSNFQMIRKFVADITIEISSQSAVGMILFNANAHIQFNLQAYTNLNTLLSAIHRLPYSGGLTDLRLLLSSAQNERLRLRNNSLKVVIVIADVSVGVAGSSLTELRRIASDPQFVFFTNSFNNTGLHQLNDEILQESCNGKLFYKSL